MEKTPGQPVVLIVDDEVVIRRLMRKLLEGEGYQIIEADDCATARGVWEKQYTDIAALIVDLMLPDGTGKDLAGEFQAAKPSLKVIFASGYGLGETSDRQNETFFVQKPFDVPALLKTVKTALGEK